jgi:hypothetical protein
VPSWRAQKSVTVAVPGIGSVTGDVAWGGNWFFLVERHGQTLSLQNVDALTDYGWRVRQALNAQGFPDVDHVELVGAPVAPGANSRSFVLCPGKAFDRSPCGTGTSAKLACLAADGKLAKVLRVRRHHRQHVHRQLLADRAPDDRAGDCSAVPSSCRGDAFDPRIHSARHRYGRKVLIVDGGVIGLCAHTSAPRQRVTLVERNAERRDGCSYRYWEIAEPLVPLAAGAVPGLKWMWDPRRRSSNRACRGNCSTGE